MRNASLLFWGALTVLVAAMVLGDGMTPGTSSLAWAGQYFNSSEPGCNGSDPTVLFCDDFEDGTWYVTNCDQGGYTDPNNDGWCGNIFGAINPPNAAVCGNKGFLSNCAAHGGPHNGGTGGVNMALHRFTTPGCSGATTVCGVDEIYVRWYYKTDAGYLWGAEKHINPTKDAGGIFWGNIQLNCGAGSASTTATPYIQEIGPSGICQSPNVSTITLQSGRWYFFEYHIKLNTPGQSNGVFELWIDDCGTDGTACPATPTLRTRVTNFLFGSRNSTADKIEVVWIENWANPGSTGTPYYDQIKAATVGPIGFTKSSAGAPPAAPSSLSVR